MIEPSSDFTGPPLTDTEIIDDSVDIISKNIQEISLSPEKIDMVMDNNGLNLFLRNNRFVTFLTAYKNKNGKVRIITEITSDNLDQCRKLSEISEVHHANELKGNFIVNKSIFAILDDINILNKHNLQLINFNNPALVTNQQFLFDSLWENSIPLLQRIEEMENEKSHKKTDTITDKKEIEKRIKDFLKNSDEIYVCSTIDGLKLIRDKFFYLHNEIVKKYKIGKYKGTRWITSINSKEDAKIVKDLLNDGIRIRHIKDITSQSINFALNDKIFYSTTDQMKEGKIMENVIYSHDPLYIEHYKAIFEYLWNSGQETTDRIKEIEGGQADNSISIIYNPEEVVNRGRDYFQNAKKEILIILPSSNSSVRLEKYSDFRFFDNLAKKGIKVKVLMPIEAQLIEKINKMILSYPLIEFRTLPFVIPYLVSTAIVDREIVMSSEKSNDHKSKYSDVIRFGIFIKSKHTALSYSSIFESLWLQTEMYKNLQMNEKIQQDFINIAAHELRTPVQSIMGYTTILQKELNHVKDYKHHLEAIKRDTNRIKRLVNRLIDVTQIENNRLILQKEKINFNDLMNELLKDYQTSSEETDKHKMKISYTTSKNISNGNILISADKIKIIQVIMNLIDNAIEFSKYNESKDKDSNIVKITANLHKKKSIDGITNKKDLLVSVIDNGPGIHPEILSKLFTKFFTTSANGTGLGLYFSKKIIEGHGGHIEATNNKKGNGATFSFNIPLLLSS